MAHKAAGLPLATIERLRYNISQAHCSMSEIGRTNL
jgi:hypothetical protein